MFFVGIASMLLTLYLEWPELFSLNRAERLPDRKWRNGGRDVQNTTEEMHDKAKEVARGDWQLYYESPVLSRYLPVKIDVVQNRVLWDGKVVGKEAV